MRFESSFRNRAAFQFAMTTAVAFLVLTALAMLTYAGGTWVDPKSEGYSFFHNFFSDLGITVTYSGKTNSTSIILFTLAVSSAGVGLIVFFIALAKRFAHSNLQRLGRIGSGLGVLTGFCFLGIAFTPQDLYSDTHDLFSMLAFLFFPLAALAYANVFARVHNYPKHFAYLFVAFALLLAGYFALFIFGPSLMTPAGLVIQATGQKLIVYASIVLLWWQARGAAQLTGAVQ